MSQTWKSEPSCDVSGAEEGLCIEWPCWRGTPDEAGGLGTVRELQPTSPLWPIAVTLILVTPGILPLLPSTVGFPGGSVVKKLPAQCRRHGFNPWVRKIPWRRKWQPTPVCLPRKPRISYPLRSTWVFIFSSLWTRLRRAHFRDERDLLQHWTVWLWALKMNFSEC